MHPCYLPGCLRIRRGEDFQTSGGVYGNQVLIGRAHGCVDSVTCTQRLTAAAAGSMAAIQRVGTVNVRLHSAIGDVQESIAHREGPGLIKLDLFKWHMCSYAILDESAPKSFRMFSAVGPDRRTA